MSDPLAVSHSNRRVDFSLTGRILGLAIPATLTSQMDNLASMADLFMISFLGSEAISAIGISRVIIVVASVAMLTVNTGALALISQAIGANDQTAASATAKQALSLLGIVSIVLGSGGILLTPFIIDWQDIEPKVATMGTVYLRIFFLGSPFMVLNFLMRNILYGAGDSRTPFYLSIIENGTKLITSYLLIFGVAIFPELGVIGAAIGGIVGRGCSFTLGLWALYSGQYAMKLLPHTSYHINLSLARRIFKVGIPAAGQGLLRNGSSIVFLKLIAMTSVSTNAIAAFTIGTQIEQVLRRVSIAFGTVATTLVGQNIGAKKLGKAEESGWSTLAIVLIIFVIIGVTIVLFAAPIMRFFSFNSQVIHIGIIYLYAMVMAEPFMCAAITMQGGLQGAGETISVLYYTLISQWIVRISGAILLAFYFNFDINGIWASLILSSAIQGILTVRRFGKGEWKKLRI